MFDLLAVPSFHLVGWLAGPFGAAVAIVVATILIRAVLVPVGIAQHRADKRRTDFFGRVAGLSEAQAADLYRAEGGSLARGCLPMLVQMPVFAGLYTLFVSPTVAGQANLLLHQTMFGVPLGAHLTSVAAPQLLVFAGLLILLALVGYASSRLLSMPNAPAFTRVLPYLSVVFALFIPLAATLYLVTTTTWTVAQTFVLRQWLG